MRSRKMRISIIKLQNGEHVECLACRVASNLSLSAAPSRGMPTQGRDVTVLPVPERVSNRKPGWMWIDTIEECPGPRNRMDECNVVRRPTAFPSEQTRPAERLGQLPLGDGRLHGVQGLLHERAQVLFLLQLGELLGQD